jgi:hypothetical protein
MGKSVFWAESHDEAQLVRRDAKYPRNRLITIFLLSEKLIFHPSYIWRSDTTRFFIYEDYSNLFVPEFASIILGDSKNVEDYILDRLLKVKIPFNDGTFSQEHHNYQKNIRKIPNDAQIIDKLFSIVTPKGKKRGVYTGLKRASKDRGFRKILSRSLMVNPNRIEENLRDKIVRSARKFSKSAEANDFCNEMKSWAIDKNNFFSREAFIDQSKNYFVHDVVNEKIVLEELLNTYFSSNVGEDIDIPFLLDYQKLFDPYNPKLFRMFFASIFGRDTAKAFFDYMSPQQQTAIIMLKQKESWNNLINEYFSVLNQVNKLYFEDKELFYLLSNLYFLSQEPYKIAITALAEISRYKLLFFAIICDYLTFSIPESKAQAFGVGGTLILTAYEYVVHFKHTLAAFKKMDAINIRKEVKRFF